MNLNFCRKSAPIGIANIREKGLICTVHNLSFTYMLNLKIEANNNDNDFY